MPTLVVTKYPGFCSQLTTCQLWVWVGNRGCKNHLSGADIVLIQTQPHMENIHGTLGAVEQFCLLPALRCLLRDATADFPCALWSDNLSLLLTYDSMPEKHLSCSRSYTSLQKIAAKFRSVSKMLIIPLMLKHFHYITRPISLLSIWFYLLPQHCLHRWLLFKYYTPARTIIHRF